MLSMMAAALVMCFSAGVERGVEGGIEQPESKDRPHVQFEIVCEQDSIAPGETATLGLVFRMEPHWHIYYLGAPGGGNPPSIEESRLPKGYRLGEIQWPAPQRFVAPGGIYDSVYENEVTLLLPVTAPADAKAGEKVAIGLKMAWLECSDVCVFGKGQASIELAVRPKDAKPKPGAGAAKIAASRARLPVPLPTDGSVSAELADGALQIRAPGAERLEFYPGQHCSDIEGMPEANVAKGEGMRLKFVNTNGSAPVADGILGIWFKGGKAGWYVVQRGVEGGSQAPGRGGESGK